MRRIIAILVLSILTLFVSCSSNKFDLDLIPVKSGEKWGYIDQKGAYVINLQFAEADFFREGLAIVKDLEGKIGFIDKEGKYVLKAQYKAATPFAGGLAFVVSEGGYPTCIDKEGNSKFSLKEAKWVSSFRDGLAIFGKLDSDGNIKIGYVDTTGKIVINPQFQRSFPFSEGMAAFEKEGKLGFIDKTGKIVINPQFEATRGFKEGKAAFSNGKQYGFIDAKGAYIINPQFDKVGDFSEGKAVFLMGGNFGYIDENGKIDINPQFDDAGAFSDGLAVIRQGTHYGYINKKGKIEINPQFDVAFPFENHIAFVKTGNKWGIIDKEGKYIANPQFDELKDPSEEVFFVETDYYDASVFIHKFFERRGSNSFDGFSAASTLQDVIDSRLYGDYAQCPGNGIESHYEHGGDNFNYVDNSEVICKNQQYITEDAVIRDVTFHFENRICYRVNGEKRYKFDEKIKVISYIITLKNGAKNRVPTFIKQMSSWLEEKYEVKFHHSVNGWGVAYDIASNNDISFGFLSPDELGENQIEFYVAFDKDAIENRIGYVYSGD